MSEPWASSPSELTAVPPSSAASFAARPEPESANSIASGGGSEVAHPRAIAAAMFPDPAKPIFMTNSVLAAAGAPNFG